MYMTRNQRDDLNEELKSISLKLNYRLAEFESMEMTWVSAYEASLKYQAMGFGSAQSYNPNIEKKNRFKTSWKRVDNETAVEAKTILESLLYSKDSISRKKKRRTRLLLKELIKEGQEVE